MARPEPLITRDRKGVQRLDPKGLRLLEDRPRTGLRLLDQDLSNAEGPGYSHWPVAAKRRPQWATSASVSVSCATGEFVLVVNGWRCAATAYDAPSPLVMVAVAEPVNGKPRTPGSLSQRRMRREAVAVSWREVGVSRPAKSAQHYPLNRGAREQHPRSIGRPEGTVN